MSRRRPVPQGRGSVFVSFCFAVCCVVCCAVCCAVPAHAAPAPHLHWQTIHTPCCDVHFPADLAVIGARAASIVDECVANAATVLQATPTERIQLTLHDTTDSPNGFANSVPYDNVELRAVTPEDDSELAKTDDWLRLLIQHEIFHIVHLDIIHGLPAIVNVVLGKSWPPNSVQPRLFVEGMAVWAETQFTNAGRLRSSLFKAPLRIAALEGDRWSLDDAANVSRRPPGGSAAYVYGSFFMEFLVRKYGPDLFAAYAHDYGGSPIPYGVQRSIEGVTGRDLALDWGEFLDEIKADADVLRDRVVARGGPTRSRRLTRLGGQLRSPTFMRDGSLLFGADPPDGPAGIYVIRGLPDAVPDPQPLVRTTDVADVAVVRGADAGDDLVVFAQTETQNAWFSYRDLFVLHPDGRVRQLTHMRRLKNPGAIPGSRSVVAEERTGSESAIVTVDVDTGVITRVVTAPPGTVLYTPSCSPDGKTVVVSMLDASGRRSIGAVALAGGADKSGELTRVLDGAGDLLDPGFSNDGAHIVFVEDRDGVFNVYAYEPKTQITRRLVDTLGGAAQPVVTPDGAALVFTDTHKDGVDLYAAPFDIAAGVVVATAAPRPFTPPRLSAPTAAPEPYNPWPMLMPRAWVPLVDGDPIRGFGIGFATDAADPANLISWSLRAAVDTGIWRPSVSAGVRFSDLYLPLSLGVELRPNISDRARSNDGVPELHQETLVRGTASLSVPLRRRRTGHTLSLGAQRAISLDETGLTSAPDALAPRYPTSVGFPVTQTFNLDWSYSATEQYRDSVSTERGLSTFIRLRGGDRHLLSDVDIRELFVDVRAFTPVPGLSNHVVAGYFSGGASFDDRPGSLFVVGGFVGRDLLQDVFAGNRSGPGVLRGFPGAQIAGDVLAAATLEYRFPLLEIEKGIETLPAFVDRIHGVVFVDTATAFDEDRNIASHAPFAVGVGGELRLQLLLGYYGLYIVRAGYARGLTTGGVDQAYAVLGFPY